MFGASSSGTTSNTSNQQHITTTTAAFNQQQQSVGGGNVSDVTTTAAAAAAAASASSPSPNSNYLRAASAYGSGHSSLNNNAPSPNLLHHGFPAHHAAPSMNDLDELESRASTSEADDDEEIQQKNEAVSKALTQGVIQASIGNELGSEHAFAHKINDYMLTYCIGKGEHAARCPGNRFVARYQFPDHVQGSGVLFGF